MNLSGYDYSQFRVRTDRIAFGQVRTIEGQVKINASRSSSGKYTTYTTDRYWLQVNGVKLMLTEAQSKAFWSGAWYRIDYLPRMYGPVPVFLSAEVIKLS